MASSGIVFVLALLTYNSTSSSITNTRELSWHLNHGDCNQIMAAENRNGAKPRFNQNLVCLRVKDHAMKAELETMRGGYPIRRGSGKLMLNFSWN